MHRKNNSAVAFGSLIYAYNNSVKERINTWYGNKGVHVLCYFWYMIRTGLRCCANERMEEVWHMTEVHHI